jgi:hypothetical protein
MRPRAPFAVSALALCAACSGCSCRRSEAGTKGDAAWYDAAPLLVSLRPSARTGLEAAAGVKALEDLPLYDLTLAIDPKSRTFDLDEEIFFTNRESAPLGEIVLRLYANSTEGGTSTKKPLVALKKGSCVIQSCTVNVVAPSTLSVAPASPVAPGGRIKIRLSLKGELDVIDDDRTNLFAQGIEGMSLLGGAEGGDYGLLAQGDGITSMANFYAVLARRRDGAWERSDDSTVGDLGSDEMSHVRAHVDVPEDFHVVTSGVTIAEKTSGSRRLVDANAAMVRDFAVIASADLSFASAKVGDVEVRAHYLDTKDHPESPAGRKVLDVATWALKDYESRFGAYPYADLDVVEAPLVGGAGGVEFAGLVTVASMFYRPALPSSGLGGMLSMLLPHSKPASATPGEPGGAASPIDSMMGSMLEFVTAHEVAHQFWHGLVGSDSRVHPYLDEGLAQYTAMMYLDDRYGLERAEQDGTLNVAMNYQAMRMLGKTDGAVDQPADAFGGTLRYAGLVYGKGPYVWRAIRKELGDEKFFKGVQSYVSKNRLRVAPPRALVDELAAVEPTLSARVQSIAVHWLDESHGDEDLGKLSLLDVVGPAMGLDTSSMDPMVKKLVEDLLQGNGGLGAGGGGLGDLGNLDKMLDDLLDDGD